MVEGSVYDATCNDCGWQGKETDLIKAPIPVQGISLDFTNPDVTLEVAKQISQHLMELIYQIASKPVGEAILRAGLVGRQDSRNLARLLRAGCLAAHKGILEEADVISKEFKASRSGIRQ
jgi:hypothetical protein